jgi:hypothetical protein
MAINWELARTPDFVGIARQAQDRGRERGMQQARQNAYAKYGTNPDQAISELMGAAPAEAIRLKLLQRQEANDASDRQRQTVIEGRQDAEYTQGQQDRTNELLGRYGLWAQRGGKATDPRMVGYWKSLGVPDELIENPDPAQLEALVYGARDVESVIEDTQQPRAPVGYMWSDDGSLTFVPGGPADPATIGRTSGVRREAVTSRPMPRAPSAARAPSQGAAPNPALSAIEAALRARGLIQ